VPQHPLSVDQRISQSFNGHFEPYHGTCVPYKTHPSFLDAQKIGKIGDDFGSKNGHKSTMDDLDDYGTFGHRIEPSNIFANKITNQCDGLIQYFGVSEKKLPSGKLTVCELENGPFIVDLPIKVVIFHSYVSLPGGI